MLAISHEDQLALQLSMVLPLEREAPSVSVA